MSNRADRRRLKNRAPQRATVYLTLHESQVVRDRPVKMSVTVTAQDDIGLAEEVVHGTLANLGYGNLMVRAALIAEIVNRQPEGFRKTVGTNIVRGLGVEFVTLPDAEDGSQVIHLKPVLRYKPLVPLEQIAREEIKARTPELWLPGDDPRQAALPGFMVGV